MCFCNGRAWITMRQREKGRGCVTYFECSESFSKIDTKQTVWHMYLPTEWELDTHKSTSKGVIEGVCSTGDEWGKLGQSFQMWITFIIHTHTAGHNNHVTAFTLWKRIFLFAESAGTINRGHFLIHGPCSIHAFRPAWFLSFMEKRQIFVCNAASPFSWCSAGLQVQKLFGVLLYLQDKTNKTNSTL